MTYIPDEDFVLKVNAGLVPGYVPWNAIGEREGIQVTVTGEDVWRGNDLSPSPTSHTSIPIPDQTTGEQMTVVSENSGDTAAGNGVRTVEIHYIDGNGDEQEEIITMNGTTGVNTTATDIKFVNDMYTKTVGSNGVSLDHIKIHKTGTAGLVYNMIAKGGNKSLVPSRMVPTGKTLVLRTWSASEAQGKRVAMKIRSTDMHGSLIPGVFCFKDSQYLNRTTSGNIDLGVTIPSGSIIKVSAWADASPAECSVSWHGILIDD